MSDGLRFVGAGDAIRGKAESEGRKARSGLTSEGEA